MNFMKRISSVIAILALAGCGIFKNENVKHCASAVSPDGRNEIRLYADPLSYEVCRDGRVVVGKSDIYMIIDGEKTAVGERGFKEISKTHKNGMLKTPVYKKSHIDISQNLTRISCGDWGLELVARNDGVAYRFYSEKTGTIAVNDESAPFVVPDPKAPCWYYLADFHGEEESVAKKSPASEVQTILVDRNEFVNRKKKGKSLIYAPFLYKIGDCVVAVTDCDVYDYPSCYYVRPEKTDDIKFNSLFPLNPSKTEKYVGWRNSFRIVKTGARWIYPVELNDYIVKCTGSRTFPWRCFLLSSSAAELCQNDLVYALARPNQNAKADFSWVRPGKVAWDWWNCFDNKRIIENGGINTKTYERFIDFAAKHNVEYVIFDEGWSKELNIWKFHPAVDVPHLIKYAKDRGVGLIFWMAWAQIYGDEERVAEHFSKLGVKGFKIDFMDRADADTERFMWKIAESCAKHKLLIDFHGCHRPTGLRRAFPNVVNYEGIHGLEQMKWYKNNYDFALSDVRSFFMRMTVGPMDYTPGAMLNFPIGQYKTVNRLPGSVGTRARQMAMMALFEAPLQMLADSPTHYEENLESFKFMAAVPVVWAETKALTGDITPDTMAACARKAYDGSWYVAAINNASRRSYELDTSFLSAGAWQAEIFKDADESNEKPRAFIHEIKDIASGERLTFNLADGGGFVVKFNKK
jgi:alpha-glucosidase